MLAATKLEATPLFAPGPAPADLAVAPPQSPATPERSSFGAAMQRALAKGPPDREPALRPDSARKLDDSKPGTVSREASPEARKSGNAVLKGKTDARAALARTSAPIEHEEQEGSAPEPACRLARRGAASATSPDPETEEEAAPPILEAAKTAVPAPTGPLPEIVWMIALPAPILPAPPAPAASVSASAPTPLCEQTESPVPAEAEMGPDTNGRIFSRRETAEATPSLPAALMSKAPSLEQAGAPVAPPVSFEAIPELQRRPMDLEAPTTRPAAKESEAGSSEPRVAPPPLVFAAAPASSVEAAKPWSNATATTLPEEAAQVSSNQAAQVLPDEAAQVSMEQAPDATTNAATTPTAPLDAPLLSSDGMAAAKSSSRVNKPVETSQTSVKPNRPLPGAATLSGAGADNARGEGLVPGATSRVSQEKAPSAQLTPPPTWISPAPATESAATVPETGPVSLAAKVAQLEQRIVNCVVELKRLQPDSMSVLLKPDAHTEVHLHLEMRGGQIDIEARCQRGDLAAMGAQWSQLQEALSSQGIRLGGLQDATSPNAGSPHSGNFSDQPRRDAPPAPPAPEPRLDQATRPSTPPARRTGTRNEPRPASERQWESWA